MMPTVQLYIMCTCTWSTIQATTCQVAIILSQVRLFFITPTQSGADGHKKTTIKVLVQYIAGCYISHPAYESWSNFKEELEVKFSPPWVELVSHEEVINNISCKKNYF